MNAKNLYRSLAKEVHPDFNGGGADFTRKMQEVNRFKNDPEMLLKLARQWGLNIDGTFDQNTFDRKSEEFKNKVYDAVVGAVIRHTFYRGRKMYNLRGVIVKVRDITKGKLQGGKEYSIYDFISERIWSFKTLNPKPFTVVGMADSNDLQRGVDRMEYAKEVQKANKKASQNRADDRFSELDIKQNFDYEKAGFNWKVDVIINRSYHIMNLVKTTAKCVYVRADYSERLHRVNVDKVVCVIK